MTASAHTVSHGELRERVEDLAAQLPDVRSGRVLVHLALRPDLASVTQYLATLEAGHVALVTPASPASGSIIRRYVPDVTATGDPDVPFETTSTSPRHLLHPDLALLMSTSGSTGSAKLVRLSRGNLLSNAAAIAEALGLRSTDRAITSLPLHYCFGLSVLHSHLAVGGSVVLHDGSVLDGRTWDVVDRTEVTTLAVVPHMVELMESTGALGARHPSLRLVAQAGGRMHPDRVLRTARLGLEQGWDLAVMYGQTEATARVSVLDPSLALEHPDTVGRPVAGTTVHVQPVAEAPEGAGELVVRGPGVMMGYAEHPDDLALGAMLTELRTGDLGHVGPDGLVRILGRRSGFVKVMGLRVDLAAVEAVFEAAGLTACVVGDDDVGLAVVVEPVPGANADDTADRARRIAGEASGAGAAAVVAAVGHLPRLANGKVDRVGCATLAQSGRAALSRGTGHAAVQPDGAEPPTAVRVAGVVGEVLGVEAVDLRRSFVQHGGDSLSHVQASVRLEALLGPLPRGWHHLPLAELAELGHGEGPGTGSAAAGFTGPLAARGRGAAPSTWRTVETSVLLRALAVVAICGSHADLFRILGGAHTLLAVAGFNAARFGLSMPTARGRWHATARAVVGVGVPTTAVALLGLLTQERYGWANVALANWVLGDVTYGFRNELWFVDALVASMLTLTAVLAVPAVGRAWRADPWRVAIAVATLAAVPRFVILAVGDGVLRGIMPTTFWLFATGVAAAHADTSRRRAVTLAAAVACGVTFFVDDPVRNATVLAGVAALTLVPAVRLPARLVPLVALLASASLYVYLLQFQVFGLVPTPLARTLAALAVGCVVWRLADRPVRRLQDLVPRPTR